MRHRMDTRKLGRTSAHRLAMYRNMVTSLLEHEKLETTHAKARELRRITDRMITLGKRGDLHARRQAMRVLRGRDVASKLFGELAERYAERPGGYTRIIKTRRRVGDAAEMSIVQLVEGKEAPAAAKPKQSGRKKAPAKAVEAKAADAKPAKKKTAKKAASTRKTASKKTASAKSPAKKSSTRKAATSKATRKKKPASKTDAD